MIILQISTLFQNPFFKLFQADSEIMCKIFADCSGFCTFFRNVCTLFQIKISSSPNGPMKKRKHKRGRFGPFRANTSHFAPSRRKSGGFFHSDVE